MSHLLRSGQMPEADQNRKDASCPRYSAEEIQADSARDREDQERGRSACNNRSIEFHS